jgi:nitric oxide reductase activation protein
MTATAEKFGSIGGFSSVLDDSFIFDGLKEKDYPSFVTKTIRLIGQQAGLRVMFAKRAEGSCFNPETKVVSVPAPPPYPRGRMATEKGFEQFKEELGKWRALVNHEVGHAMFTLWKASKKAKKIDAERKLYPVAHHMFNDLFENGRMERVACDHYPGMIRDLQKLEGFLAEIITNMYKSNPANFNHIYYALRMVVNGYEPAIDIPEHMQKDWKVVRKMAQAAWDTDDEEETYKIAQKVAKYLKKRYEEEKGKSEDAKDEEQELKEQLEALEQLKEALEGMESDSMGSGSDSEGGEGEGKEGESSEPQSCKMPWEEDEKKGLSIGFGSGEEGEEGEEDEDEEGAGSGEGTEDEEEGEGKGEGDEEDADSESKGKGEGDESEDDNNESESEEGEKKLNDLKKEIEEKKKEIEDKIKEKIKAKMTAESLSEKDVKEVDPTKEYEVEHSGDVVYRGGDVIPLPLHDYVQCIDVEVREHSTRTKAILDECMIAVSGMAQRFIQKVRSRIHVGVRTFKGRVNRRKLHRYKYDSNIFKTQNLRKKKDACVYIIVDCSGSMGGSKIDTARKAALVIGEMMHRAGVEFEIRGFTVFYGSQYTLGCFTRQADLIHYRFGGSKDWAHSQHTVVDGHLLHHLQDNDDGESLRHFADELSQSKKDSKMMVVISDGQPACGAQAGNTHKDLKKVVPEIRESGIDMYAIGLDTNVAQYYGDDKSVRLSSYASITELVESIGQFVNLITVQ